jgi:hypothetical protein
MNRLENIIKLMPKEVVFDEDEWGVISVRFPFGIDQAMREIAASELPVLRSCVPIAKKALEDSYSLWRRRVDAQERVITACSEIDELRAKAELLKAILKRESFEERFTKDIVIEIDSILNG